MITYKEAYDKIIQAYFKDEIQPYNAKFCFCGTLANGSGWYSGQGGYSYKEYTNMEVALLHTITKEFAKLHIWGLNEYEKANHPEWENFLFEGMCAALEVLKQIHIERGEIIDEGLNLTKRELQTV